MTDNTDQAVGCACKPFREAHLPTWSAHPQASMVQGFARRPQTREMRLVLANTASGSYLRTRTKELV